MIGAPTLEIHKWTEDYAIATFGPVLLQLWQRSVPVEGAQEARRVARELSLAGFEATGSLIIVPLGSLVPEKEARVELTQIPTELKNGVGLVLVQEGTGFRASAIRAVLSTMMLLSRRSMPHDVAPSVALGSTWLTKRLKVPGGIRGLIGATTELRALYHESESMKLAVGS